MGMLGKIALWAAIVVGVGFLSEAIDSDFGVALASAALWMAIDQRKGTEK